jgi:hypothetical protein
MKENSLTHMETIYILIHIQYSTVYRRGGWVDYKLCYV